MKYALFTLSLITALISCSSNAPVFKKMSDEEIAAYNASVDFADQVWCRREVRAGSHIKRRYCETFDEMLNNYISSISKLNATNAGAPVTFSGL